jgi:hypothetical protein
MNNKTTLPLLDAAVHDEVVDCLFARERIRANGDLRFDDAFEPQSDCHRLCDRQR